ncbi:HAMP domain-containing protein [Pseudobutyrivibrio sp. 49]|uniref:sensor histidine kinase n=1 Tax=Pseudobutyrivibrio sp. 49 TaxID=1855344 RepID=UPI0008838DCF|nr:histidine kinase dimerization/phospho-acceptor domain-containing protein [Pseudobutyrivibrio sp. 49]SDI12140.1 HAMP domain-containing protein [Pseudobutyrivibrio sp. 49]
MIKVRKLLSKSLYIELAIAVCISVLLGAICYFFLSRFSADVSSSKWFDNTYKEYKINSLIDNLQTFIYEESVDSGDTSPLNDWYDSNPRAFFYLKKDNSIIYSSFYNPGYAETTIDADDAEFKENVDIYSDYFPEQTTRTLNLTDCKLTLCLFTDVQYSFYSNLLRLSIAISALISLIVLVLFVRNKINYINDVTQGIRILEGGNLDYQVPVKGNDEISQVAESLNSMRIALDQQMKNEKQALQANNSLVTALSHDLRTPLTTQMGYLEILKEHHYNSPEEMDKYINTALDTCHQIKEMSDRLFEYFLAFDPHPERPAEALEEYDGVALFMQLISELSLPLEAQGFSFEFEEPKDTFNIHVNMNDILRIFNNVFTNIDKYADEAEPVRIRIFHDNENAVLSITNKIRKEPRKNESAKIGLISISSLMKRQSGASKTRTSRDHFTLELKFPITKLTKA